ncbi:hypothetical protein AAFF_G00372690 [Aldrovandia affinis]|uniref:Endonuclease-reverse transcriptase n=1 Tax=Aldrovandia affinis TaxID=143900 RepID=A0AAD7SGC8_9TELE|nr:hypothetical protein AAFF_G00372690 [Aldrovandia affinis]
MIIGQDQHHPPLSLGEHDIEYVDNFTYLGSNISSTRNVEKDVRTRIGKAAGVFQRLRNIWSSNAITTAIKLRLYMSVVIPTATYACETWMKTASITNMLDVFHRRCLRTILKISWRDHITNAEVMRRTGVALLSDMVSDRRRRLAGHVLRLPRERPASVAMDWVPEGGKRKRGRPKKTWRHTFKEDLNEMGVSWHGARRVASDRCRWRGFVAQCSNRNGRN